MPKRRKTNAEGAADVPEEELQRRRRQKEQRDLALKLRASGKTYDPKKRRIDALGSSSGGGGKKQRVGVAVAVPHMVILPIYWNTRVDERERVLLVARKALAVLQGAGVDVKLDTDDTYTPGQKMKYWETKGVKVRVEIGPKEALAGTCLLALANKPGEVANKSSVNVEKALKGRALAALADRGVKVEPPAAAGAITAGDQQPAAAAVAAAGGVAAAVAQQAAGDHAAAEAGAQPGQPEGKKGKKAKQAAKEQQGQDGTAGQAATEDAEGSRLQKSKKKKSKQGGEELQQEGQQPQEQQQQGVGKGAKKQKAKHAQPEVVQGSGGAAQPVPAGLAHNLPTTGATDASAARTKPAGTGSKAGKQQQPQQEGQNAKASKQQQFISGDAMDDFVIEVQEEGTKRDKAKGKEKKKHKGQHDADDSSHTQVAAAVKHKRAKVVEF